MKIIAVMSPKGGIGKTTTSDSIAYMLGEEQGKRVLFVKMPSDKQLNKVREYNKKKIENWVDVQQEQLHVQLTDAQNFVASAMSCSIIEISLLRL